MTLLNKTSQSGHVTVALLIITVVGIVVSTALVGMVAVSALGTYRFQAGSSVIAAAEGGLENAILRLLRDSSYTGETTTISGVPVTIEVSGTDPLVAVATARSGQFYRAMAAELTIVNGLVSVSDWYELPAQP